ncbi:hypothetical protein M406DRAFT_245702 [Cryphonectria parasitica EP155]|uniref:Uncharacterized protein n=1 Tax=Cryphonectria parasitica (strain ATCC 38755 / EP155) TaxID=660469 RepID=A0A9P4YBD4_CRYP1|nr:uncharacterized protein M406DRAFT_245702 [Cryphonectria parasitica EP155]KAF3770218.1 hypothetical protein M406DRAFT_245702 [Cryphonectria parasitica EP155]
MAIRQIVRPRGSLRPPSTTRFILPNKRTLSTVPRIAEVSFWKSLVPKPLRRENRHPSSPNAPKKSWLSKEWNPATFFIVIFLLIGSMSIQMISLRKNFDAFVRRSDVRIGLLREVVERIQNGEDVDVEKILGTGDPETEAAWEEVLEEIEKDGALKKEKKQDKGKANEASSPAITKAVAVPKSVMDAAPTRETPVAQEPSKGRTAYFF